MKKTISIGSRSIGPGNPIYVVAEMSGNHGQSFDKAVKIIHAMKESGADAVKLQTYTADTITIDCDRGEFKIGKGTPWEGRTLYELYSEAFTPWDWQPKLKKIANDLGMDLFSTPFDPTAVDFLEGMDVPAYKIASYELVDIPLIEKAAKTGKPIIMSTGMGSKEEIQEAVNAVHNAENEQLILLKCTCAYPAPPEEMNLRTIQDMPERFGVLVGLSDHTLGIEVPIAAVKLGACVVEKHFCLSRIESGPDAAFSIEPDEFRKMVEAIRAIEFDIHSQDIDERILGEVYYGPSDQERKCLLLRRSLYAVKDIAKGEKLTGKNMRSIRPGNGLPPKELPKILGKKALHDVKRGTPMSWELIGK